MIIISNKKSNTPAPDRAIAVVDDSYTVRITNKEAQALLGRKPKGPVTTKDVRAILDGNNGKIISQLTGACVEFEIDMSLPDSIGTSTGYRNQFDHSRGLTRAEVAKPKTRVPSLSI